MSQNTPRLEEQIKVSDKLITQDKALILKPHNSNDTNFIPMNLENRTFSISNRAVLGCQPMTIAEAKLFRILLSQVTFYGDEETDHPYTLKPYRVKVADLAKKLDIKGKSAYEKVQNICVSLHTRYLFVKRDNEWDSYSLIVRCSYSRGYITLYLNEHLKEFVYGLDEFFSIYQLESILTFSQKHALRIYEAIKCRIGQNKKLRIIFDSCKPIEMTLSSEELREITATITKYPQFYDFKKNVVNCGIAEIDEKSDIFLKHLNNENQTKDDDFIFEVLKKPIAVEPDISDIMLANTFVTKDYITTLLSLAKRDKEKELNHLDELFAHYEGQKSKFDKDFLYALSHARYSIGAYMLSMAKSDQPKNISKLPSAALEFVSNDEEKYFNEAFDLVFNTWNQIADSNVITDSFGLEPVRYKTIKCRRLLKVLLDDDITIDEILHGMEVANTSLYFLNNHNNFTYFLQLDNFKAIVNGDEVNDSQELRMAEYCQTLTQLF